MLNIAVPRWLSVPVLHASFVPFVAYAWLHIGEIPDEPPREMIGALLFSALVALWFYARVVLFAAPADRPSFREAALASLPFLILFAITPPIVSKDVEGYGVLAWSTWHRGVNPYVTPMANVADHPWLPLSGNPFWLKEVTPYGPLAIVGYWPGLLGAAGGLRGYAAAYTLFATALFVLVLAWVAFRAQRDVSERQEAWADLPLLLLLNPVVLLNGILEGHNEILVLSFVVLGLRWAEEDRFPLAAVALAIAVAIKVSVLPILPVLWFRNGRPSAPRAVASAAAVVAVYLAAMAPFSFAFRGVWEGLQMQAKLNCFFVCSPVTWFFDLVLPDQSRLAGTLLGALVVITAGVLCLWRSPRPHLFAAVSLCGILVASVRFLTPWYFLLPLPLLTLASEDAFRNRLAILAVTAYSFSLYLKFWGEVGMFR